MGFGLVAAAVVGGRELHRDGQCQHPVRPNKARARLLPASQMLPQLASSPPMSPPRPRTGTAPVDFRGKLQDDEAMRTQLLSHVLDLIFILSLLCCAGWALFHGQKRRVLC